MNRFILFSRERSFGHLRKSYTEEDLFNNTTPDPESSLVKMYESGHFTVINLIKWCD